MKIIFLLGALGNLICIAAVWPRLDGLLLAATVSAFLLAAASNAKEVFK